MELGETKPVWVDFRGAALRVTPSFLRWRSRHENARHRRYLARPDNLAAFLNKAAFSAATKRPLFLLWIGHPMDDREVAARLPAGREPNDVQGAGSLCAASEPGVLLNISAKLSRISSPDLVGSCAQATRRRG